MAIQMNITGGLVSVEDGIPAKTGDFDPKRKVKVELSFTVPEGADAQPVLTFASKMAHDQVYALLGKAVKPAEAASVAAGLAAARAAKKPAAKPADTGRTKADLAAEAGVPAADTVHKAPVDELDDTPAPKPAAKPADDDLGDLLGDSAPAAVTDQELGKAAQEKNGKMKGVAGWAPEKIRALVGKYVQVDGKPKAGAKLQEVPAAQRHEFLKELEALK